MPLSFRKDKCWLQRKKKEENTNRSNIVTYIMRSLGMNSLFLLTFLVMPVEHLPQTHLGWCWGSQPTNKEKGVQVQNERRIKQRHTSYQKTCHKYLFSNLINFINVYNSLLSSCHIKVRSLPRKRMKDFWKYSHSSQFP